MLLARAAGEPPADAYQPDALKAAFLYRFTGYVDWPAAALSQPEFTIAVLDADGVVDELVRILPQHPVRNLPARVRKIASVRDLAGAQLLYVGSTYLGNLRTLADSLAGRPVLLVTDREDALDEGSAVNFLLLDRRLRFEISLAAAEQAGLRIAPALLTLAVHVRGAPAGVSCTPPLPGRGDPASCLLSGAHS